MGEFRMVCDEELVLLESSLEHHMPVSGQMLNIVKLKVQGRIMAPTRVDLYIYDDGQENPWIDPFVLSSTTLYGILLRPPANPTSNMIQALDCFLDWDKVHVFLDIPQNFFDNHLRKLFLKHRREEEWDEHPCEAFTLQHDLAMTYLKDYRYTDSTFGDSVEVRSLRDEDVDQVLENYEWTRPHSKTPVLLTIQNSISCGLYVKRPEEEEVLASFALFSPVGLLNILYTEVPYRRRGFGVQVLQSLGRRVVEMGFTPRAEFEVWNDASKLVQTKAGYEFVDKICSIVFKLEN